MTDLDLDQIADGLPAHYDYCDLLIDPSLRCECTATPDILALLDAVKRSS